MTSQSGARGPGSPDGEQRFDEESARRILRLASERQARREGEEGHSYTLEQLQEIAAEAGISPDAIEAAAREHEASLAPRPPRLRYALVAAAGVGLLALLVAVVGVAPVAFALLGVLLVVLLFLFVGLGPF